MARQPVQFQPLHPALGAPSLQQVQEGQGPAAVDAVAGTDRAGLSLVVEVAGRAFLQELQLGAGQADNNVHPFVFGGLRNLNRGGAALEGLGYHIGRMAGLLADSVGKVGRGGGLYRANNQGVGKAVAVHTVKGGGAIFPFGPTE